MMSYRNQEKMKLGQESESERGAREKREHGGLSEETRGFYISNARKNELNLKLNY